MWRTSRHTRYALRTLMDFLPSLHVFAEPFLFTLPPPPLHFLYFRHVHIILEIFERVFKIKPIKSIQTSDKEELVLVVACWTLTRHPIATDGNLHDQVKCIRGDDALAF